MFLHAEEYALPPAYRQVVQALRYLAGADTGRFGDAMGFSRVHSTDGKSLARRFREKRLHLNANQLRYGYKIISTYSRQLAAAGLSVPSQPEIDQAAEEIAMGAAAATLAHQQYLLEQARAATAPAAPSAPTRRAPASCIVRRGDLLFIRFPFNPRLVEVMHDLQALRDQRALKEKHLPYVRFVDPATGWQAPAALLEEVVDRLPGFARSDEVEKGWAAIQQRRGAEEEARQRRQREAAERVGKLYAALGDLTAQLANGWRLYQHQIEAVETLAVWGSGILAYEMGLGKSLVGCVLGKAYEAAYGARVIVVGPRTLRVTWMREAAAVGLGIEYYTYERMPSAEDLRADLFQRPYVLFADEAAAFQNMAAQRTRRAIDLAWGALGCFPITGTPMRNGRPRELYPLLLMTRHELVYAELPDGSPDTKRIAELKADYVRRYCDGHTNEEGFYDSAGAIRLDELHHMVVRSERGVLRKRKDECLDLPRKIRKFAQVSLLDEEVRRYDRELHALWQGYHRRLAEKLEQYRAVEMEGDLEAALARSSESHGAPRDILELAALKEAIEAELLARRKEDLESGEALVSLGHLRQAGSHAKARAAVETVRQLFEEDAESAAEAAEEGAPHKSAQIVIFTAFTETARLLADALHAYGVGLLSVESDDRQRQADIDGFQANRLRVMVCLYGAGGVGVTLTKANVVLLLDRPWTPGDTEQAEDRLHRISQDSEVLAIWLQLPEEITRVDQKIDAVLLQKQERAIKVLDGTLDNLPPDILFKNIAKAMLEDVVAERLQKKAETSA